MFLFKMTKMMMSTIYRINKLFWKQTLHTFIHSAMIRYRHKYSDIYKLVILHPECHEKS